jgi:hypothetical protein
LEISKKLKVDFGLGIRSLVEGLELCYDKNVKKLPPAKNGRYLRLFDRFGNLRLTRADAEAEARKAEAEKARIFAEKLRSLGIDPDQLL